VILKALCNHFANSEISAEMDKPSVLILINGYHPKIGGAERQAEALALALLKKGCRVQVLTLRFDKSLKKDEVVNGIPVTRISYPSLPFLGTFVYMIKVFLYLYRTRTVWDVYYVVIVEYFAFAASLFGKIFRKPVVLKFTGLGLFGVEYIRGRRFTGLLSWAIKKADAYIAVSREIRRELISFGLPETKVYYLPNGVDCSTFKPPTQDEKKEIRSRLKIKDVFTFVFAGRFVPVKDIPGLLKAWRHVTKRSTDMQLLLIGNGILFEEMDRLVIELGLKENTHLLGRRDDISDIYRAADVGVLPSHNEGLSNVLLEMMASGLLVVATDIDTNADVIESDVSGLLFRPGDVYGLSNTIYKAYSNYAAYGPLMGLARAKIEKEYSIDSVASSYVSIFDDIRIKKGISSNDN